MANTLSNHSHKNFPTSHSLVEDLISLIVAPVPGFGRMTHQPGDPEHDDDEAFRRSIHADLEDECERTIQFVGSRLRAYDGIKGLLDLRVRASAYSRPSPQESGWVSLGSNGSGDEAIEPTSQDLSNQDPHEVITTEGLHAWRVVTRVGPKPDPKTGSRPFGILSALFEDQETAVDGIRPLTSLAGELALILRVLRRGADRSALVRLATVLSDPGERGEVLARMADILKLKMRSDGVRVYVVRLIRGRPCLELLFQSRRAGDSSDPDDRDRHRIGTKKGLTDWVISNNKCILIPDPVRPPNVGIEKEQALTDEGEWERILARPEGKRRSFTDEETGMCLAPLRIDGSAMGAFIVWRREGTTYSSDSDLFPLAHYASMIAAGARWRISREATRNKAEEISKLGEIVSAAAPFTDVFDAVAAGVGRLSHAARSMVMRWDPDSDAFYCAGVWTDPNLEDEAASLPRVMIHVNSITNDPDEIEAVINNLTHLSEAGGRQLRIRGILPISPDDSCKDRVVVMDEVREPHEAEIRTLDDDLGDEIPCAYLSQVHALLNNHVRTLAQAAVEQFSNQPREEKRAHRDEPELVLARTPCVLGKSLGCDAVLVYGETAEGAMKVHTTWPEADGLVGLGVVQGSQTDQQITTGRELRILDVNDEPEKHNLNRRVLEQIAAEFNWTGIRSWICYPVLSGGRCVGVLKLITCNGGRFLGPSHLQVVQSVAARASWEMQQIAQNLALQSINELASELASLEGESLATAMADGLKAILGRAAGFPSEILVTATVTAPTPRAFVASSGIDDAVRSELTSLSGDRPTDSFDGSVGSKRFYAAPVCLPGESPIRGHLFIVREKQATAHEIFVATEAAREIAVVLDRERRRHLWRRQVGVFRHAVLGPVQGLTTTGRLLHKRAVEAGGETDELKKLKSVIEGEAEAIRLWRVAQRLFFSEKFEARPLLRSLRELLEYCVDRYREVFVRRGMNIVCQWRIEPSFTIVYDYQLLDVAISNLLDNACKYGFFNRTVIVGAEVEGDDVLIWVEDQGHDIPDRIKETVYEFDVRSEDIDPIRAIDGMGLGLPIVKRIAEVHEGRLYYNSTPIGEDRSDPKHPQPHRVRFTLRLPKNR